MSKTNDTTKSILNFLFAAGIFSWRQNVLPIPIVGGGFRPGGKSGQPDIVGILPNHGKYLGVEIKSGKDKLSDVQIGFHKQARNAGALILVVKDFQDFLIQWNNFLNSCPKK